MSTQTLLQMPNKDLFEHGTPDIESSLNINHNIPFPWKLHELLETAEEEGFMEIVCWLPDEHSFRVHAVKPFVERIMKRFFKQTKYKSFQRQLNMWGFTRIMNGPDKGGYSHNFFVRGKPSLCCHMTRLKVKGTGSTGSTSPSSIKSIQTTVPIMKAKLHSTPALPPSVFSSSTATTNFANSMGIMNRQENNLGREEHHLFEDATLDQVLQCAILDVSSDDQEQQDFFDESGGDFSMPTEGDSVLFEGRQFFFVEDYHPPASSTDGNEVSNVPRQKAQRRMSIELNMSTLGGNQSNYSKPKRRLSLLPMSQMTNAVVGIQSNAITQVPLGTVASGRPCRRFSLERVSSTSHSTSGVYPSMHAGYVLRQL